MVGFVVGVAAELGPQPPQEILDGTIDRATYIDRHADQWRALDPAAFPFVHYIVEEFAVHDDAEQFRGSRPPSRRSPAAGRTLINQEHHPSSSFFPAGCRIGGWLFVAGVEGGRWDRRS
ncbi:MAG: hypothetical protein QM714_17420 [Nocardioides sp.]|uniref:hypothetical protein n=1 Tax=Nocardioides sp. TaxID=35761 RepID=UPI0039E5BD30